MKSIMILFSYFVSTCLLLKVFIIFMIQNDEVKSSLKSLKKKKEILFIYKVLQYLSQSYSKNNM